MKYAIIVPVYNRPEYLQRFLLSLWDAIKFSYLDKEIQIVLCDDCSTDEQTKAILKHYSFSNNVLSSDKNRGVAENLRESIDAIDSEIYLCFDSDTIMTNNCLTRLIQLHNRFPDYIVSGFDSRNTNHHRPIFQGTDYCIKESIGGASMVFSKETYQSIVRPALLAEKKAKRTWDFITCDNAKATDKRLICSTPSVVEHIGIDSTLRHNTVAKAFNYGCDRLFVSQPFGIGDVIFSAALVEKFNAKSVVWPVLPQFVDGCRRSYPQFEFVPRGSTQISDERRDDHYIGDMRYIPIRWTQVIKHEPYARVMRSKYDYYGEDWKDWKTVEPIRNLERENLLKKILNISENEPYILTSIRYGSDSQFIRHIELPSSIREIEMKTIGDFSIFDWIGVIEDATEIHAVSSSILYLAALFAKGKMFVYLRTPQETDFSTVDYIFNNDNFLWERVQ